MAKGISTGCTLIDKTLGKGLPLGQLTLAYGESNTGKTTLAIQSAVNSAKNGLKTIFIDSDNSFSANRLSQIAYPNVSTISQFIFVLKPHSFYEQSILIENLNNYLTRDVVLIVVDTITSLYRVELGPVYKAFSLNRELNRQLAYLGELVKTHNVAILVLSQVHSIVQKIELKKLTEPVATRVLKFWSQNILCLENTLQPSVKEVILEKGLNTSEIGSSHHYILNKRGIVGTD
ncbi:MAG: repair protein RadB [Thermoproteota archaeon]|nr:repair protein RadB [Thermoproteota archaeon]